MVYVPKNKDNVGALETSKVNFLRNDIFHIFPYQLSASSMSTLMSCASMEIFFYKSFFSLAFELLKTNSEEHFISGSFVHISVYGT